MSAKKKSVRKDFRDSVFKRDNYSCKICGYKPNRTEIIENCLDAHHITDRHDMPFGGYVLENGITLCKISKNCHLKAENRETGYEPETLYKLIRSSLNKAIEQSNKVLGENHGSS